MTKIHTLAATVALSLAAISVQAADIQMYGRVDAGLRYTNYHDSSKDDSFGLQAGNRAHNRIGLNIREDLGNGLQAKVYLENGFTIDDGDMDTSGQLFNRRSILALKGGFGEVGMGRMGTVQSTVAPYSMGLIKWDPFATSYSQASIGSTFANTSRVNNAITWQSPSMAGWRLGATYSMGDSSDEIGDEYEAYADHDHTLALATDYQNENLYLSLTYAHVAYGNVENGEMTDDGNLFGFGGWWRFMPQSKVYFGAQYQKHWDSAAGLGLKDMQNKALWNYKPSKDDPTKEVADTPKEALAGGYDGYSLLLGGTYEFGQNKLLASVQYFDGELANASEYDYNFLVFGTAWEYKLAKTVWFYVAATHSIDGGKISNAKFDDEDARQAATEVMTGINWNF